MMSATWEPTLPSGSRDQVIKKKKKKEFHENSRSHNFQRKYENFDQNFNCDNLN